MLGVADCYFYKCNNVSLYVIYTGRGVFILQAKAKDSFLVEYHGELVSAEEGYRREQIRDSVFRYFVPFNKQHWW